MEYDQEFIKEEVRCDWPISILTKKVWFVQIDLIKEFDRICRKYDLKWYPFFGTLLGCVRHNGYIPWDDDVDVVMPRKDFDKFVNICKKEIREPYFLQTTLSDEQCYMMWVSLRNSNTTGNRRSCLNKKQNNGIAIDIIPLDGCENKGRIYKRNRRLLQIITVLCNTYVNEINTTTLAVILRKFLRLFPIDYKKVYLWAERQNRKYIWDDYEYVTFRALAPLPPKAESVMYRKDDFKDTVMMPFEYISIPVPIGYDRILKTTYGDYMKFPPIDKREGKHDIIYAPDEPYKEYCSREFNVKYSSVTKEKI